MPEEQNNSSPSETQRDSDATLQRSTPKEDATSQRDTAGDVHDPEKKKLHEEAASHRKRARELEADLKVYQEAEKAKQEADLTELEKTGKRIAEKDQALQERDQLIQQLKQQLVSAETKAIASGMDFHNPEIAAKLVQDSLEFGEDGKPTNLEKALEALAKGNPFLLKQKAEAPAETTPASPAQTVTPPALQTPAIPAMNPGRTNIAAPNQLPPGQPVRLDQLQWKRRP